MDKHSVRTAFKLFISGEKYYTIGNAGRAFHVYSDETSKRGAGWFACVLLLLPASLAAQAPEDLNARFQAMEQRIKSLESEVSALKAALSAQAPAAPEPAAPKSP